MVVVCASVFSTVVVLNFHHRKSETHDMSPFFRRLFLHWLPWVLMMKRPGHKIYRNPWSIAVQELDPEGNDDLPAGAMQAFEMHPHIQLIYEEVKFIVNRMKQKLREKEVADDWKFAAMVVDRLCLITFSGFLVCSTCAIIFSAPNMS